MDSTKPSKPKLSAKISKFLHLHNTSTTINSNTQKQISQNKAAAMEAFIAKLFAEIASLKAAYAELQIAQFPYNSSAIQVADQDVVNELKKISELKKKYYTKQFDRVSPHVGLLLAEIQEQQSLIKLYQITLRKLENGIDIKDAEIDSLKKELGESINATHRLLVENKLRKSSDVCFSNLNLNGFVRVLDHARKAVRRFVKLLIQEMANAGWNLDLASKAVIEHNLESSDSRNSFVFESFVWRVMINGFNDHYFSIEESDKDQNQNRHVFFEEFKNLRSVNPRQFFAQNPDCKFSKFVRSKYMQMVHPKMECSLFGNLHQRGLVKAGKCPDTDFFAGFSDMAKRVWLLHCLGFSFQSGINAFQIRKNCRFSEVYMESVTENVFESKEGDVLQVAFMVVPGFMIGKSVIQSQVFLSSANC